MGSVSFFHFSIILLPFLLLLIVGYVLFLILRKPRNESISSLQPEAALITSTTLDINQLGKIKWLASGGYIFALTDAFLAQFVGFYQFYFFGFHVCFLTLVPFVIFYCINKSHEQPAVAQHLKSSIRLYGIYVTWSLANGILLFVIGLIYGLLGDSSGLNIIHWLLGASISIVMLGASISIVMLGVLAWLAVRCGQGIIAAFKLSMPDRASQEDVTLPAD